MLSAVGLYGVMSFSVNQRTQEFGIRMALGADAARIFRMVMRQGAWQLAIGLFLGVVAPRCSSAFWRPQALQNILFKVNRSIPLFTWPWPACSPWWRRSPVLSPPGALRASIRLSRCGRNNCVAVLRFSHASLG